MVTFTQANNSIDLEDILKLQRKNLRGQLSAEEITSQGFVYIEHDFAQLSKMNHPHPHTIAKSDNRLIVYALVLLKDYAVDVPILYDLFQVINSFKYKRKLLKDEKYFVMGLVCIDKAFRSKNVFKGLYKHLAISMNKDFNYIITEVSVNNTRSLRAHEKIGFETLVEHTDKLDQRWRIIILEI